MKRGRSHGREGAMDALMLGDGRSISQVAPATFFYLHGRSCWFDNAY